MTAAVVGLSIRQPLPVGECTDGRDCHSFVREVNTTCHCGFEGILEDRMVCSHCGAVLYDWARG